MEWTQSEWDYSNTEWWTSILKSLNIEKDKKLINELMISILDTDGLYLSKGEFLIVGMGCCPTHYGCWYKRVLVNIDLSWCWSGRCLLCICHETMS